MANLQRSPVMKHTTILLAAFAALSLPVDAATLLGVTDANRLVSFDTSAPATFLTNFAITGLKAADGVTNDPGAVLVNLAWNSDTGTHYGIDTNANFYSVSQAGVATLIDNTFSPTGFAAGLAYDPFTQKFLYASNTAESVLIATSGARTNNPALVYGTGDANQATTPVIFGTGIDTDFGTSYFVDSNLNILSSSLDPNFSELLTIGGLGINVTSFGGLVVDMDGLLWGTLSTDGITSSLYSINTTTGAATLAAGFGTGVGMHSIAQVPEPSRALLLGLAGAGLLFRRRRVAVA
jgi:hypothetical protein